jgi:hypothetical protein
MINSQNGITNEGLVYSLFNQYMFAEAKANIENLEYYFTTNPATQGNPLIEELVKAIKTYSFESIGEPLFRSILMKCRKSDAEANQIMSEVIRWKQYTKEEIKPAAQYLKDIVSASIITKANCMFKDSPTEFLKYIKNYNFKTSDAEVFSSIGFKDIDINTLIAESGDNIVSTNVNFLNEAFQPYCGLERGQLGIICAPPGVGKSLEAMNLALWMASQGERVLFICLGDNTMKDFIVRMGSIALGLSFAEAYKNLGLVYDNLRSIVGDNLQVSINPAGVISAEEIVEKVKADNPSVVFIDYDSNIKGACEGDSMYLSMGNIYNKFTELTLDGKLVFVCSQPKNGVWKSFIGLKDIGESSRKQHACDFCITISDMYEDNPNHIYKMALVKARRGEVGSSAYVIRIQGRFIEIPVDVYKMIGQTKEKMNYTERDIEEMIKKLNRSNFRVNQNLQAAQSSLPPTQTNLKNPFTNARP